MNTITFLSDMKKLASRVYNCPVRLRFSTPTAPAAATFFFENRGAFAGDVANDCYHTLLNAGYEGVATIQTRNHQVLIEMLPDQDKADCKSLLF